MCVGWCEVGWQQFWRVYTALLRGADDRSNKVSQGLGPSLLALPPPLPSLLPPAPSVCHHTPCGHMWSDPNGTQLDSHLPCRTGHTSAILSEFQCLAPDGTAAGRISTPGGDVCSIFFSSFQLLHRSFWFYHLLMSKRTMCVMWLKSGLRATVGLKEQERWSCLVADPHWCMGSLTVWAHHSYLFTHQTPHATLIHALLWWVSVGKHLFSRHALLHLRVVTASACKQGDANCLSPSFYGTQGEQTNKSGNFTQQPVKHSHSAHGGKCNQVPSAVIQPRTHGNMPTWKQMSTISHTHIP